MDIAFITPVWPSVPMGGIKILCEYANLLAEKRHNVTIYVYAINMGKRIWLPGALKKKLVSYVVKKRPNWFELRNVTVIPIFEISGKSIKEHDALIATNVNVIQKVSELKKDGIIKYNLIQDFENWNGWTAEAVYKTYNMNLKNIAVSEWLKSFVEMHSESNCYLVSNGIDIEKFRCINPVENRNPYSVIFHFREAEIKGGKYALETIKIVEKKYHDLHVTVISTEPRPQYLPQRYKYIQRASIEKIVEENNKSAIFICASIKEGFGLPALEAMACGCAVVSTDYLGGRDFLIDNENALLSPVRDAKKMADNIIRLIENDDLRFRIAYKGIADAKKHSNKNAVTQLESILKENV